MKKKSDLRKNLLKSAREAAFAAAEAMDRRDAKTWTRFQEMASNLRQRARKLGKKKRNQIL